MLDGVDGDWIGGGCKEEEVWMDGYIAVARTRKYAMLCRTDKKKKIKNPKKEINCRKSNFSNCVSSALSSHK